MLDSNLAPGSPTPIPDSWLLVAEIEHRIANEYALAVASISLAARRSADQGAKAALTEAAQRLRDYAAAHRVLGAPASGGWQDLTDYLGELCSALSRASLAERGVSVKVSLVGRDIVIEAQRCWRVGLIVSELITNAVRHGFHGGGGVIAIEVAQGGDLIHCRVRDNGRPAPLLVAGSGSQVVNALTRELGGQIERRFEPRGTTVVFSFPE